VGNGKGIKWNAFKNWKILKKIILFENVVITDRF
jgi:hypothetical protein